MIEPNGNTPYRRDYRKTKRLKILILIIGLPLLAGTYLAVRVIQKKDAARKSGSAQTENAATNRSGLRKSNRGIDPVTMKSYQDAASEADAEADREYRETLDEIQRQIAKNQPQKEAPGEQTPAAAETTAATGSETEPGNEPKTTYVDRFKKQRYNLTVRWQMRGGVDIFVTDSYTGEMRIRHNYTEEGPLTLFQPDRRQGNRRFFGLIERLLEGGSGVYMLDSFSGDIQARSNVTEDQTLYFFREPPQGELNRYSAQIIYNSGKIDVFIQDDCTSQTRVRRGLERVDTLALFSEEDRQQVPGRPHFFAWAELLTDRIDLYTIDQTSGNLRVKNRIDDLRDVSLFAPRQPDYPPRYSGWVDFRDGHIDFYAVDHYIGQLKVFRDLEGKTELKLFDWPLDSNGWPRYSVWVVYVHPSYWIYSFDSISGELKSDAADSLDKPYRGVAIDIGPEPEQSRYQVQLQWRMQGGIDAYVMDTFNSEIRVAQVITEKKIVSLFE